MPAWRWWPQPPDVAQGRTTRLLHADRLAAVEHGPSTRLVFVETIANPRTQVADLAGIGTLCDERGLLYVVDSTLTTPVLFLGRDVQAAWWCTR